MKKLIAVFALIFSQLAMAGSRVDLPVPNGGILSPNGGKIQIDIKQYAIAGVRYNVTCHVTAQDSMMMSFSAYGFSSISINSDKKGRTGGVQDMVKAGDNTIIFTNVSGGDVTGFATSQFTIQNIDNALTATVTSCFAEAMTL